MTWRDKVQMDAGVQDSRTGHVVPNASTPLVKTTVHHYTILWTIQCHPHNALSLLYPTSVADDSYLGDSKYDISDKNKLDAKNSRRKMERPRKRKKESESDGDGGSGETIVDLDNPSSPSIETILKRNCRFGNSK